MRLVKNFTSEIVNSDDDTFFFTFIKKLNDSFIVCDYYSDNFLYIFNIQTNNAIKIQNDDYYISYFSLSKTKKEIAFSSKNILIFGLNGDIKDEIEHDCLVETFSHDDSGKYLFIFYVDFSLKIYNLAEKKFIDSSNFDFLKNNKHYIYSIKFNINNNHIALKTSNEILIVKNDNLIKSIDINSSWIEFSNNGKYLASCYYDNSENIHIYNTETWEIEKIISGIEEENKYLNYHDDILSVCFSPDDKYLVGSYLGAIKVFEFETGDKIYETRDSNSQNVAFSDDGKYICFNDGKGLKLFEFDFTDYYELKKQKILEKSLVDEVKGEIEYDDLKLELNKTEFFVDEENLETLKISFKAPINRKCLITIESIEDEYSKAADEYLGRDYQIEIYKEELFNGFVENENQQCIWSFRKKENGFVNDGIYLIILSSDNREVKKTITKYGASMFISKEHAKIAKKGVPRFIFDASITIEPARDDKDNYL